METRNPLSGPFTLSKAERLCSQKIIAGLFQPGFFVSAFPIRIHWLWVNSEPVSGVPAQVLFSVGKRRFKKASDRNRIRRQLRELYRLEKPAFLAQIPPGKGMLALAVIYTGSEPLAYPRLKQAFDKAMAKCIQSLNHA
ncbi:MAG: ribonuclease P protein component [Bacteroidetes bacterium]|nr:ribonuclease P protein component [Bacteroidota bacterium]